MYKWLMPIMKEVRYAIEKKSGTALDWGSETERNHMLHESAVPIAQLYEPLFQVDDTFLLQEYFCPCSQFKSWISRTKPIYKRLAATTEVVLLNTTIRFVEQDVDTFLPYAKDQEGMFAFVLYYRLPRTAAADAKMKEFHDWFVKETLSTQWKLLFALPTLGRGHADFIFLQVFSLRMFEACFLRSISNLKLQQVRLSLCNILQHRSFGFGA